MHATRAFYTGLAVRLLVGSAVAAWMAFAPPHQLEYQLGAVAFVIMVLFSVQHSLLEWRTL